MKGRPVDQLVYEAMFPKPRSTDVQNFQSLLHRHLILEVRQEVHSFYGHLDTQEAKYPGLDYCHPIHRIRLGRWPWHRRLFRAFDALRLTNCEIANLTKWEGTKWAKDRFERDSGVTIQDTAADDIPLWSEPEDRVRTIANASGETLRAISPELREEEEQEDEEEEEGEEEEEEELGEEEITDEDMEAEEESDGELESVGFALNQHLRERAARNDAGELSEHYEREWEQWLKNAIDSGEFASLMDPNQQHGDTNLIPQALFPPNMLSAARAGQWDGIPDWLRDIMRQTIELERTPRNPQAPVFIPTSTLRSFRTSTTVPATSQSRSPGSMESIFERLANWRRSYPDLRLPENEENRSSVTEVRVQRIA